MANKYLITCMICRKENCRKFYDIGGGIDFDCDLAIDRPGLCVNCYQSYKCYYCRGIRNLQGKYKTWNRCDYCVEEFTYCRVCNKSVDPSEIGTDVDTTVCKDCIDKCVKCKKRSPEITLEQNMCNSCIRCAPCIHCKYKCCRQCKKIR